MSFRKKVGVGGRKINKKSGFHPRSGRRNRKSDCLNWDIALRDALVKKDKIRKKANWKKKHWGVRIEVWFSDSIWISSFFSFFFWFFFLHLRAFPEKLKRKSDGNKDGRPRNLLFSPPPPRFVDNCSLALYEFGQKKEGN